MSNIVLPNTFQCFNIYIDHALEHLTDSEVRILWYATRHILGWQNKIKKKQGHISLTMFEHGFTDSNGNYYGGCGLGRGAIISACKSLVEFKLLLRVDDRTQDGQGWELITGDIQWEKLEARTAERITKQKAKTLKATTAMMNKRAGTSDVPLAIVSLGGTCHVTMQGTSDVTMQGNVARTESNSLLNPSLNPEELNTSAAIATAPIPIPNPVEEKTDAVNQALEHVNKIAPPKPKNPLQEAVKITFKTDYGSFNGLIGGFLTASSNNKGEWKEYQIDDPPMPPLEIVAFGDWYATTYPKVYAENKKPPITPKTLSPRIMEFRGQLDHDKYMSRAAPIFMAILNQSPPEPPQDLPPPNPELARRADEIINRMARGESIHDLISA